MGKEGMAGPVTRASLIHRAEQNSQRAHRASSLGGHRRMLGGGRITNGSALTLLHQAGLPLLLPCTFLPPGRIPARLSRLPAPKKKRREPALLFVRAADREKLQDIQPQSRGCSALHRGKPRSSCSRRFWKNTPASRSEPQRGSNPDIPYKPPTSTRIAPPPQFTL